MGLNSPPFGCPSTSNSHTMCVLLGYSDYICMLRVKNDYLALFVQNDCLYLKLPVVNST